MCVHRPSGLRIRLCPLIVIMMVAACQTVLAAEGSPAPSAQEKLDAIRMSLVEAALQTPTSVKGMSWIDGSGALHELSVFKNSLKIQAVRVKGYERTSDGQVKAKTEIAGAATPNAHATESGSRSCPSTKASASLRHPIHFSFLPEHRLHPAVTHVLASAIQQQWLDTSPPGQPWVMVTDPGKPALANAMTSYERTLAGSPGGAQPWQVSLQASSRLLQVPRKANWLGSDPWVQIRMSLRLTPMDRNAKPQELQSDMQFPLEGSDWAPAALGPASVATIRLQLETWRQALNEWLLCEPLHIRVTQSQNLTMTINMGRLAGVNVGDEWLIAHPSQFPQHMLEAGAMQQTLLARTTSVGVNTASLTLLAGSVPGSLTNWRAWPVDGLMNDPDLSLVLAQAKSNRPPHPAGNP
jgi:hypothetical protein